VFYRFTKSGARIAVDLDGIYAGETLFLLGGSPQLNELPLGLLRQPGIVTMGMNNVPCTFRPTLWAAADKPVCFSPHIYTDPGILKFTIISRTELEVPNTGGKRTREMPNMLFFGARETFTFKNFLDPHQDLVWWRSTFPIVLQLAHRLGFSDVFLVGCGFNMKKQAGKQYAWDTGLTDGQANYSQNTYNRDVERLKALKPTFDYHGFRVRSSTPESAANEILGYVPLEEAVKEVLERKPRQAKAEELVHSSALRGKK
jgi:hypothetical protein